MASRFLLLPLMMMMCLLMAAPPTIVASVAPTMEEASIKTKRLTEDSMSQSIRKMEYAVRGSVVIAADKIAEELRDQGKKHKQIRYDFDHIVMTNIGNPQALGQKPLSWPRQVMALVDLNPEDGVDHPEAYKLFPADAIRRAKEIKAACGSSGAYSHSKGVKALREDVANFIHKRDGYPADPEDIYLTNGASTGIVMILNALIADSTCGVMIPTPQYPIYSATIDLYGGKKVGYYLEEENGWDLNIKELERSLKEAQSNGVNVVALTLINPGNPTGAVLGKRTLKDVIRFCVKHKLVLLADEVYQENVYDDRVEFCSVKKAASELGVLQKDKLELISFHSASKGVFGECGRRAGYLEMAGIDPKVKDQIYKLASSGLCASLNGQIMTSLMCRGPSPGDESFESHNAEMKQLFEKLKRKSKIVSDGLNKIPGFSCQPAQGAMYSFPSVSMPQGAIDEAREKGISPDTLYALSLLERTGICVVPASGFEQKPGRYGFRTTFLPTEEEMERCVELMRIHHEEFCLKYGSSD